MAIEREDLRSRIAVRPPSSRLQGFNPSTGGAEYALRGLGREVDKIGDQILAYGEDRQKIKADDAAKQQANSVEMKDENGNYVRPPPPSSFGYGTAKLYNEAMDRRYSTGLVLESESKFNQITADNLDNPQRASILMREYATTVASNADPRVRGSVANALQREVLERERYLLYQNAQRDRANTISGLNGQMDTLMTKAQDALEQGNENLARSIIGEINEHRRTLLGMKASGVPDDATFNNIARSLIANGRVVKAVRDEIAKGTLTGNDIDQLIKITQGNAVNASVSGFSDKWIRDNIPNAKARTELTRRLTQIRIEYNKQVGGQVEEQNYLQWKSYYERGGKGMVLSPEMHDKYFNRWLAERNMAPNAAGILAGFQHTGTVPTTTIKRIFGGIQGRANGADFPQVVQLWEQLRNMPIVGAGGQETNLTSALDDKDNNFMRVYTYQRNQVGLDHTNAYSATMKIVENIPKETNINDDQRFVLQSIQRANPNITNGTKLNEWFANKFDEVSIPLLRDGRKWRDIPIAAEREIRIGTAQNLVLGMSPSDAFNDAIKTFERTWTKEPGTGRLIPKRDMIPAVQIPGEKPNHSWVKTMWKDLTGKGPVDPNEDAMDVNPERVKMITHWKTQGGKRVPVELPEGVEPGKNLIFRKLHSGVFIGKFIDDGGREWTIQNEQGVPIQFNLQRYADSANAILQDISRNERLDPAELKRQYEMRLQTIPSETSASPEPPLTGRKLNESDLPKARPDIILQNYQASYQPGTGPGARMEKVTPRAIREAAGLGGERTDGEPAARKVIYGTDADSFKDYKKAYEPGWWYVHNEGKAANVNPKLVDIINKAASTLPDGYSVHLTSGHRPHGREGSRHYHGQALDVKILKNGKPLPNYQNTAAFSIYEKFAQESYKIMLSEYPEYRHSYRWGGYFSGGRSKYGAMDLMHFDVNPWTGMGGGSWKNGLTRIQRKIWPGATSIGLAYQAIKTAAGYGDDD